MVSEIIKRDGRTVPFNETKIASAIFKAMQSCGLSDFQKAEDLAAKVCATFDGKNIKSPTVEMVQDEVERVLMNSGLTDVAKSYILYRSERSKVRERNTRLMKTYYDITFKSAFENDIKRENANIDGDTAMGTMLKYGSEGAKEFYLNQVLLPEHAKAHRVGDIHIHDLDFLTLTLTCCQIDILELFKGGFSTGHGFLREPNSVLSYASLACIAIQANQNDQHGGQSIPNFDYGIAPGVMKTYRKMYVSNMGKVLSIFGVENADEAAKNIYNKIMENDKVWPIIDDNNGYKEVEATYLADLLDQEHIALAQAFAKREAYKETEKQTYQAMEALIHNLNTMHSRAGAQVPFSSINYGTDTSSEGRMVMKQLLLATEAGLGNGETPIFPIQILKIKEGIDYNPGDPNYDIFKLACRVSSKRLFPNFSFIDAPYNLQYYKKGDYKTEVAYMGCRTRVIGNVYDPTREIVTGRGNLSFTSINLPRIAIEANHDIKKFYTMLDEKVQLVIDQLMARFRIQQSKKVYNFPFLMGQGVWLDSEKLSRDDSVAEVIKHGTLSCGFIGLAECLIALIGKHHGESKEAQKLGLEIVSYMRKRLDMESQRTGLNFSLLATPAEGLSGRFVKLDKERYGVIPGVTDKDYYTNSFHVPVYYHITAFDKISIESKYHPLTNAGHISYIELDGSPTKNLDAFEKIVRHMKECGIGYGSINHPLDRDPECGYSGVINDVCPGCGRNEDEVKFERIRRITGYLVGTLDRFNNAKRKEVEDRVKHGI